MAVKVLIQGNTTAYLELDPDLSYFHDVIRFLHDYPFMDKKVLHKFWTSVTVIDVTHIRFKYKGAFYRFTPKEVAEALYLPRDTGAQTYDRDVIKAQFDAIGLQGEFKATIKKSCLPPKWRVIAEVLLWCFSSKTDGWNEISNIMQQMMFAFINGYTTLFMPAMFLKP